MLFKLHLHQSFDLPAKVANKKDRRVINKLLHALTANMNRNSFLRVNVALFLLLAYYSFTVECTSDLSGSECSRNYDRVINLGCSIDDSFTTTACETPCMGALLDWIQSCHMDPRSAAANFQEGNCDNKYCI